MLVLSLASGDVLEVACGTGRNLQYFTGSVRSLVGVDSSKAMLEIAQSKSAQLRLPFPVRLFII